MNCNHPESECYCCGWIIKSLGTTYLDVPVCSVCMEMIEDKSEIGMLHPLYIREDSIINTSLQLDLRDKEHSYFLLFNIPVSLDEVFRGNFNELIRS